MGYEEEMLSVLYDSFKVRSEKDKLRDLFFLLLKKNGVVDVSKGTGLPVKGIDKVSPMADLLIKNTTFVEFANEIQAQDPNLYSKFLMYSRAILDNESPRGELVAVKVKGEQYNRGCSNHDLMRMTDDYFYCGECDNLFMEL